MGFDSSHISRKLLPHLHSNPSECQLCSMWGSWWGEIFKRLTFTRLNFEKQKINVFDSMLHKKSKYIAQYAMHTPRIWLFLMLGIINYLWIDGKFYCLELPRNGNCGNCDNWDGEKEDCQWLENFLQRRANTFCLYTHHKIYRAGCLEDYEYMKSTKNQYTILKQKHQYTK